MTCFDNKPKVKGRRLNVLPDNPVQQDSSCTLGTGRFPPWLHRRLPRGSNLFKTHQILDTQRLPTVCEQAKCPNLLECYSQKTATFLVLGEECTRACGFCDIAFSAQPKPPEEDEPQRLAESVKQLGLKHVVITMVARDDLLDGGASHLARIVKEVIRSNPHTTIEVLTSDFSGNVDALEVVLSSGIHIFNHNIETVKELSPRVRHRATYDQSLALLQSAKETEKALFIKSGIMVGLGETEKQVENTLCDLAQIGCDIITIGQYLQANRHKLRVKSFVTPAQFNKYAEFARSIGIKHVYAGPFVRSSYNAKLVFDTISNEHLIEEKTDVRT